VADPAVKRFQPKGSFSFRSHDATVDRAHPIYRKKAPHQYG
jgi:hypothetical protein